MRKASETVLGASALGACLLLFALTATRWVQGGDSAEFALVGHEGGVPHPSGYPLFVLWLRAWSWLPAMSPAHRGAVATALAAPLAAFFAFKSARAWGASVLGAAAATAFFMLSARTWTAFTHPEVFGLNVVLALAMALVCAPTPPLRGAKRLAALGIVSGLGFANHMSFALLFPLGVCGLVTGWRQAEPRSRVRGVAAMFALAALGLTPYAYFLHVARHLDGRWAWGDTSTFSALLHHVLRADYGTFELANGDAASDTRGHVGLLASSFAADYLYLPIAIMAYGVVASWKRARGATFAYLATLVLAGPLFVARFNINVGTLTPYIVGRFFLLPEALALIAFSQGITAIEERVRPQARPLVTVVAAAAALAGGAVGFLASRAHNGPEVENYLQDTLDSTPPNAVVFVKGDVQVFGFAFLQRADGKRRDVTFVSLSLFAADWYRSRIEQSLSVTFPADKDGMFDLAQVTDILLSKQHPVAFAVYDAMIDMVLSTHANYPSGTLVRVLPRGVNAPSLRAQEEENERLYLAFRANRAPPPTVRASWQANVYDHYRRAWNALAADYTERGDRAAAARCTARSAAFALPTEDAAAR